MDDKLTRLIELSRELANPAFELAILGEGNTSVDCEDGTFWVKTSGSQLSTITESGFSRVRGKRVQELLDDQHLNDAGVAEGLKSSLVEPSMSKPSVETFLHALCIYEGGVKWIGHTHPISVMSILCSKEGARPFMQHIYPDEIVGCGEMPAVVPYVDPGLALARAVRDELRRYLEKIGYAPKLILMENHGMVALGQSPKDVMTISLTADKWARTLLGTFSMGGPRFLTGQQARRIETRPDEAYRRTQISMKS
ncbi:MAG: class II aldolase/adducin family protein [Anaerolineaceae bacterium]|nr:class II aldolase/adducin family protein [Anaerolineaceae bacterium]